MADTTPQEIRSEDIRPKDLREAQNTSNKRPRDLADQLGISEAQLVAAHVGFGATRIEAHPNLLIPEVEALGNVMALTRNDSCVIEKVGRYVDYRPGDHASMIFSKTIDLRFFPSHWKHAFALEQQTDKGPKRSIQIFDAAGDAVHKIHLRPESNHDAWPGFVGGLNLKDPSQTIAVSPRKPVEPAKSNLEKRDVLLAEWERLTDTHQFLRLCAKLRMNRLGAYRIADAPFVRQLAPQAVTTMLEDVQAAGIEFMFFVGNQGCIEIHSGPIGRLEQMGPWQNILDPGFDMHLREDHVAEVWAVTKPTRRGPAISVEAFDNRGALIFQAFGVGFEGRDSRAEWNKIVADLPALEGVSA